MTVFLGPAVSIVVRKSTLTAHAIGVAGLVGVVGDFVSEDDDLLVLGPLYVEDDARVTLEKLGLEWYDDFFGINHTGGDVPEWCQVGLRLRADEN